MERSSMDQWRKVKGIKNPADVGTRGISIEKLDESGWLNGLAWLQTDEERWPKPWCQLNEVEAEQATTTVATETKLDQLFDWRHYNSFRIRHEGTSQSRRDPPSRTNFVSICSKQKLAEYFKVDNK